MYVLFPGNLLQANRVIPGGIILGSAQDLPSLYKATKSNIVKLYDAKVNFIVGIDKLGDVLPTYVSLRQHDDCPWWFVPDFTVKVAARYAIERLDANGVHQYDTVTETDIENMMLCGVKIVAVCCSEGDCPSKAFRAKFGFRREVSGELIYAVPGATAAKKAKPKAPKAVAVSNNVNGY